MKFFVRASILALSIFSHAEALKRSLFTDFVQAERRYKTSVKRKNATETEDWGKRLWGAYDALMAARTKSENVRSFRPKLVKHEEVAAAWQEYAKKEMSAIRKGLENELNKQTEIFSRGGDMNALIKLVSSDPLYAKFFPEFVDAVIALPQNVAKMLAPLQEEIADLQKDRVHLNDLIDQQELSIRAAQSDIATLMGKRANMLKKIDELKGEKTANEAFKQANNAVDAAYRDYEKIVHNPQATEADVKKVLAVLRDAWTSYEKAAQGQIASIKESLYRDLIKGALG